MKRVVLLGVFAVLLAAPVAAHAQGAAPSGADPVSKMVKGSFDRISRLLTASAEKMPEENYAFKPTPEVRSFGAILAHVANSQYGYCARVKGEKNPNDGNDFEKKTAKADIVKALNDSTAYCSAVYAGMTDTGAVEPVAMPPAANPPAAAQGAKPAQPPPAKLQGLIANVTHDWEHYGNLVTYLRLKGLVPPSSERPPAAGR